jgi:hypothetical protein
VGERRPSSGGEAVSEKAIGYWLLAMRKTPSAGCLHGYSD